MAQRSNAGEAESHIQTEDELKFPTLLELKQSIPSHCFQRCLATSLGVVIKDYLLIYALFSVFSHLPVVFQPVYWFLQGKNLLQSGASSPRFRVIILTSLAGAMLFALFVDGHDCGHKSFSNYQRLNDIVGTFVHSVALFYM